MLRIRVEGKTDEIVAFLAEHRDLIVSQSGLSKSDYFFDSYSMDIEMGIPLPTFACIKCGHVGQTWRTLLKVTSSIKAEMCVCRVCHNVYEPPHYNSTNFKELKKLAGLD